MVDLKNVFSNNLSNLMAQHNETISDLAAKTNIAYSTVSDWYHGRKMPRSGALQKLADHFNVNITDLLTQKVNENINNYHSDNYSKENNYKNKISQIMNAYPSGGNPLIPASVEDLEKVAVKRNYQVRVPIVGNIACGEPILAEENIVGYRDLTFDHKPDGTLFILQCKGHSMEPLIWDGSFVTIRQQSTVESGEIAAVLINDEATVKRVKYIKDDIFGKEVLLIPENKKYNTITLNKNNPGRILGKVIHVDFDVL